MLVVIASVVVAILAVVLDSTMVAVELVRGMMLVVLIHSFVTMPIEHHLVLVMTIVSKVGPIATVELRSLVVTVEIIHLRPASSLLVHVYSLVVSVVVPHVVAACVASSLIVAELAVSTHVCASFILCKGRWHPTIESNEKRRNLEASGKRGIITACCKSFQTQTLNYLTYLDSPLLLKECFLCCCLLNRPLPPGPPPNCCYAI